MAHNLRNTELFAVSMIVFIFIGKLQAVYMICDIVCPICTPKVHVLPNYIAVLKTQLFLFVVIK